MKQKLFISSLVAFLALENLSADETKLDEIYITTATKTEKSIDGVTASVVVITKEDMEKVAATTIGDALKKIPSINVQLGRFPHPSSASKGSVSIRGVSPNGTLILLDGKRLGGETEQAYELERIPTSIIERIEIVKGSMSTLYGSDAIGGVINIITKQNIDTFSTTLDVKYGSNAHSKARQKNANFSTMGNVDGFKYKIYAQAIDNSSYKKSVAYTQKAINPQNGTDIPHIQNGKKGLLGVSYVDSSELYNSGLSLEKNLTDNLTLGVDFNYFEEQRDGDYLGSSPQIGEDGMVLNTPVNSKDKNHRYDASIFAKYDINDDLSTSLRYYKSIYKKRNETKAINFSSPINTKFNANVEVDSIESTTTYVLNDSNIITLGLDYRKEKRDSSAINPDASSSEFVRKNVEYKAVYLQDEVEFTDNLSATIGARYDAISNAKNKATLQAGVVQKLDENNKLRANFSQGYRSPDIAELYVFSPLFKDGKRFGAEVLNPPLKTNSYDLKAEESNNYEIAYENRFNDLLTELVFFRTDIKNKIDLKAYGTGGTKYYTSENLDKVRINGIELNLDYKFTDSFDSTFNLTYLNTKDKSTNKKLTFTPNISAALNLSYKIIEPLKSNINIRYIGKQYEDTLNQNRIDDYTLVDLGLSYDINKTFTLYGGVENIFNQKIDENADINVGTYYFAGLRARF